jgi:hypothetical protein
MKTTEFIQKYDPCNEGAEFARQFETMAEVWRSCKRPNWLFWILEKHAPLETSQSVRLAIHFAKAAIGNWKDKADQRPALAIQAAKTWLKNPTEENQVAAEVAAEEAVMAAAKAADAAARAAARAAWAAARSAADAAARAAARAAWSAAEAAEEAACDTIRQFIPNPFETERGGA